MQGFFQTVLNELAGVLPIMAVLTTVPLIPYIIAEQMRPAVARPRWQDYALNIVIAITTVVLSLPLGMFAGLAAKQLHAVTGIAPLPVPFAEIAATPVAGPILLMLTPLLLHDLWFYWSHRLEHRWPVLWAFHSLHHSDPVMNCSTWARDHFMQSVWRSFFPVFTLGLLVDLDTRTAGQAAMLSMLLFSLWSMFYHSAIRVELPWLDRILVTPQVHRIHHSVDPRHHNRNFADLFPVLDILFGTYEKPARGAFPATGLADTALTPTTPVAAQVNPVLRALKIR